VIDLLKVRDHYKETIGVIMSDPMIIKLFHGCDSDLQLMASDLDTVVVNVFDTARAYQFLQKLPEDSPKHINLASLE
jgi:ribonuclease D